MARYRLKGVPVIFGGIHPSATPDEPLMHAGAVCVGEAEHLWGAILDDAAVLANLLDQGDLLERMAGAGCQSPFIGFESINAHSIRDVAKRQNRLESYGRLIAAIHARGTMVNASMVFGSDFLFVGEHRASVSAAREVANGILFVQSGVSEIRQAAARLARMGFMNAVGRVARRLSYGVQRKTATWGLTRGAKGDGEVLRSDSSASSTARSCSGND